MIQPSPDDHLPHGASVSCGSWPSRTHFPLPLAPGNTWVQLRFGCVEPDQRPLPQIARHVMDSTVNDCLFHQELCWLIAHMLFATKDEHPSIKRKHMKDFNSISPIRFTPTDSISRAASQVTCAAIPTPPPSSTAKEIYERVHQEISKRYQSFDQNKELGFNGKPGVTGNIDFISKKDLIGILQHLKENKSAQQESQKNSAQSRILDKIYLMSGNKEAGGTHWNLRLHNYSVRGNGLGGEESPHYHRWTLGSAILAGGYNNINYSEHSTSQPHDSKNRYNKYLLGATGAQVSQSGRDTQLISQAVMTPTKTEIYAKGDLKHFPTQLAHSVDTAPDFMGTTLTLAHTGASVSDTSYAYEKDELAQLPSVRYDTPEAFVKAIDLRIVQLQVLDLQDNLSDLLNAKHHRNEPLTHGETQHLRDSKEFNHVETSLLPALAIYNMEKTNGIEHREFSPDTAQFLDSQLSQINHRVLNTMIEGNQTDLMDKRLSVVLEPGGFAQAMEERQGKHL
mgnify:CR=1 FL=1